MLPVINDAAPIARAACCNNSLRVVSCFSAIRKPPETGYSLPDSTTARSHTHEYYDHNCNGHAVHGGINAWFTTTGATGYSPSECVATASEAGNVGYLPYPITTFERSRPAADASRGMYG